MGCFDAEYARLAFRPLDDRALGAQFVALGLAALQLSMLGAIAGFTAIADLPGRRGLAWSRRADGEPFLAACLTYFLTTGKRKTPSDIRITTGVSRPGRDRRFHLQDTRPPNGLVQVYLDAIESACTRCRGVRTTVRAHQRERYSASRPTSARK
jgi:hypothetical protein